MSLVVRTHRIPEVLALLRVILSVSTCVDIVDECGSRRRRQYGIDRHLSMVIG